MRILFIGSVSLSASLLTELINMNKNIIGVFTKNESNFNSDFCNLKNIANKAKIPIYMTQNINGIEEIKIIKELSPDIIFCFGWSNLLKEKILDIPKIGTIGFHPAELPSNRGRHPIIWALILGLNKTASTFYFMNSGIDSGNILDQEIILISPEDDAGSLYEKIRDTSLKQLRSFVPKLEKGDFVSLPQDENKSNTWRKRSYKDGIIDWRMSSDSIHNLIRGLSRPYFGAEFSYKNNTYKIWKSKVIKFNKKNIEPGKVIHVNEGNLVIKTGSEALEIIEIEPKLELKVGEYI